MRVARVQLVVLGTALCVMALCPGKGVVAGKRGRARGVRVEMSKNKNREVDSNLKRRLLREAETPWRGLRTFFYGAFGFSAGVGGLTALAQLAASATGQADALPVAKSLTNVGVDLAVVAACVAGWRIDARAEADVQTETVPGPLSETEAAERTGALLRLRVIVGVDDRRREATLETLRAVAKQSIVVIGGPRKMVDDALTDALIQQKLFARAECLVVPFRVDDDDDAPSKPVDNAGFVALPAADDLDEWDAYVRSEIDTAMSQGAANALTDGVVIALRQDGTVARRGVGKPPWKTLIDQLALTKALSS